MALIDLTTQALPPQVPSKVLTTTAVTESATGTFRIKWDDISIDLLCFLWLALWGKPNHENRRRCSNISWASA